MDLDHTDREIIEVLKKNSRIPWRDLGEKVFLTGQSVGNRIKRLEEAEIIKAYTVEVDEAQLGRPLLAIVTIFMKSNNHNEFRSFLSTQEAVREAHRITGEGCYSLKVLAADQEELNDFLDKVLQYANYRVNLSIGKIK
ncbi:MAG: transcriptional regulator [Paenibacillus sp.]|jgi:Lrp/AsnC family leucine-responsive transcriptional regulator|nr:transcriptional regulator [Paenibacillus sp.]